MSVQQAGTDVRVLRELEDFPLVEALFGRRSRRFARGGEIPDGPLAYRSVHEPVPLSELERMLVLGAMGGTTGWHFSITRHARYAPHVSGQRPDPRPGVQACVARQAQYVFDTFGKFPGTVPSVFIMHYVQAHHLDLDFYDRFFKPGAYLRTHAEHMQRWARRAGRENDRWASTYARGPWTCGSSAREPVRTSCSSQG